MKKKAFVFLGLITLLFVPGCQKGPGEGGNSSITGKIKVRDFNPNFTVLNGTYPGHDEQVYVIYGDEISYGDRIRANYNGEFEFKYLRPGKYTVYLYSKDSTLQSPSGDVTLIQEVEISKKKETVAIPEITIYK